MSASGGRIVGVLPAAGYAMRLQPLDGSKEMVEVLGAPLLGHAIDRLRAAAVDEVRVVTRPEKEDVAAYAAAAGGTVILGHPPSLGASIALGLRGLLSEDRVLLGFPDSLWWPVNGFTRLLERLAEGAEVVLGLFRMDEPWRSDVVSLDDNERVVGIDVKPEAPVDDLVWGCLAARAAALAGVAGAADPGHYLRRLAEDRRVRGVRLGDVYLDLGTRHALASAQGWRSAADALAAVRSPRGHVRTAATKHT